MAQPLMLQREITRNASVFWGVTWGLMHLNHLYSVLIRRPKPKFHANMNLESAPLCCSQTPQRTCLQPPSPCRFVLIFSWCTHYWANNPCAHEGVFARPFLAAAQGHHDRFQPGQLPLHTNVTLVTQSSSLQQECAHPGKSQGLPWYI